MRTVFISNLERIDDVHNTSGLLPQQTAEDPRPRLPDVGICMDPSGVITNVDKDELHDQASSPNEKDGHGSLALCHAAKGMSVSHRVDMELQARA